MSELNGLRRHTLDARAMDLLALLEDRDGATLAECVLALGWTPHHVRAAIDHARHHVCPQLRVTIPHPVPEDGFRYHLTGEWLRRDGRPAIEAGTAYALGQLEARLASLRRDVKVARGNLDPKSIPGRKVAFLDKHLDRVVSTLESIGSSVTPEAERPSAVSA